jgi:hypothetical protein
MRGKCERPTDRRFDCGLGVVEFSEIRDLGDRIVAIGRWITRGEESGVETTPPLAAVVDFENGKAIRVRSYLDPKEALAAVGLRE